MRGQERRFLSLLLSVALVFESVMPTLAAAHDSGLPSANQVAEQTRQMAQLVAQANQMPAGQPRGSFAPDRFLLLEQERVGRSYVGRSFSFFSNAIERDLEEHQYRLQSAREIYSKIREFRGDVPEAKNACGDGQKGITEAGISAAVVEHLNTGRRKDTPNFVWDVKDKPADLACVEERVRQVILEWSYQLGTLWESRDSLTEVPNVTQAKEKHSQRLFNWWDVRVSVLDKEEKDGGSVVAYLDMHKTADGRTIKEDSASYSCTTGDTCRFSLRSGEQMLNKFHIPAKAVAVIGPYIVFVHEQSYDATEGIQYLSFIDLATYGASLGQADIPVFRLPIAAEEAANSLTVTNKGILVNGKNPVALEAFLAASEMQQMAFNITSNLVDPDSIAQIVPYIDSIQAVMSKLVSNEMADSAAQAGDLKKAQVLYDKLGQDLKAQILQNKDIADFTTGKRITPTKEQMEALPQVTKDLLDTYSKGFAQTDLLKTRASAIGARMSASRTLKARLQSFFNRLTSPVPDASLKVKRALVMVGANSEVHRGMFWRMLLDRPWLTSTLLMTGITAAVAPDAFHQIAQGGLSIGSAIFDYLKFATLGMGEAISKGTYATFGSLLDGGTAIKKQYWDGDHFSKTLIGLSAFVPFILSLFYVPHLLFNLHKIALDSKKPNWNGFVDHQQRFVAEYYKRLADDEVKRRKMVVNGEEKEVQFSAEEEAEILAFVADRKANSPAYKANSKIGRAWTRTTEVFSNLKAKVMGSKAVAESGIDKHAVTGLWSAISSITFSFPAMELTLARWTKFWNWFSGTRYTSFGFLTLKDLGLKYNLPIFVRPKLVVMGTRLFFPDFFNTTVAKANSVPKNGKDHQPVTIPTVLNGGLRTWEARDLTWIKEALFGKPSVVREAEEEVQRELTKSEFKAVADQFEKAVIDAEQAVFSEALNAAIRRMPDYLADKKELAQLFKERQLSSAVEKRVREMPVQVRTFLRIYTEQIYGASMKELLKPMLDQAAADDEAIQDRKDLSLAEIKAQLLELRRKNGDAEAFSFDGAKARLVAQRMGEDDAIYTAAAKQAKRGEFSISNFLTNRKYNIVADMDPEQNPSMARYATVQGRLKSPNALSRAVRAEISKLLITFPINLSLKMLLAAGIFETAFAPIQNELWGPNSIAYFSRDAFYMGMCSGFVIGMMADAWYKLQQDARQDELGDFGLVPTGEDAQRSFLRWYMKQYSAENNSLLGNWAFANKIIFWNFPAALVNMGFFYWLFSGRLDLSYILGGYALGFGTPLSAFGMKVDQAFERSSEFAARGIKDEKWLAHPAIQEVISKEKQYYRNRFQLLNDILIQVQGNWTQNVETVKTSLGTRGFVRAIFGGPLIEEAVVENLLRPAKEAVKGVPVVDSVVQAVANGCEHLLTNNNKDLNIKGGH